MNSLKITQLVENEIAKIDQLELIEVIQNHRTTPRVESREWNYGYASYDCWILIENSKLNCAIAFCESGFDPESPFGVLAAHRGDLSMGMDSEWYLSLEDAVRNSSLWNGENPPGYEVQ